MMRHVDEYIDDPASDPYAREWLGAFRRPAAERLARPFEGALFCTHAGERFRVTGCSRLGDVWLSRDPSKAHGYDLRVLVDTCEQWGAQW